MKTPRSVYRRGADDGLVMGPLLTASVLLFGVSTAHLWAFPLMCVCALAVPVVLYVQLRRGYAEDAGTSTFSGLWLHGICSFFFGSLMMAIVVYAVLRFAVPGFIAEQFRIVTEFYSSAGGEEGHRMAEMIDTAVRDGHLPTPIEVAVELVYAGVFTGSLLSMLEAWIVRLRGRRHRAG